MNRELVRAQERLARDVPEVIDVLEWAREESASPERVEQARRQAGEFLEEYREFLSLLTGDEQTEMRHTLGRQIERVNDLLGKLPVSY